MSHRTATHLRECHQLTHTVAPYWEIEISWADSRVEESPTTTLIVTLNRLNHQYHFPKESIRNDRPSNIVNGPLCVCHLEVITGLGSDYPTPHQSESLPPAGLKTVGSAKDIRSDNTGQSPGERDWVTDFVLNSIHPLFLWKHKLLF